MKPFDGQWLPPEAIAEIITRVVGATLRYAKMPPANKKISVDIKCGELRVGGAWYIRLETATPKKRES